MPVTRNQLDPARLNTAAVLPYELRLEDFRLAIQDVYDFFFDVKEENDRPRRIDNPQVGQYYITGGDAYLATTGLPFARPGTSKPLHIRYVVGGLPFKDCLEDIYRLSVLAWGRPDDCSRLPITIKMTDRALGEEATEYDEDALRYGTSSKRASA